MPELLTAPPAGSWVVERLAVEGLDALAAFQQHACADQFHAGFFADRDAVRRRLAWQYLEAPGVQAGQTPVWVLRRGEAIIGQLAIVPAQLTIGGQRLQGGWCQDFVVAPEHRSRGAGAWLLREAVQAAGADMDVILAGGTNASSYPVFRFAGFEDLGALPRAIGLAPVIRLLSFGGGRSIRVEPAGDAGEAIEAWWAAHGPSYAACARRDGAWWRWRCSRHPHWRYEAWVARRNGRMAGYLVWRRATIRLYGRRIPTGWVVDAAAEDCAVASVLLGQAARAAQRLGCRMLRCDVQDQRLDARRLMDRWLWPVTSKNRVLIKVSGRRAVPQVPRLPAWFLSAADSDFDLYEPRR